MKFMVTEMLDNSWVRCPEQHERSLPPLAVVRDAVEDRVQKNLLAGLGTTSSLGSRAIFFFIEMFGVTQRSRYFSRWQSIPFVI